MATITGDEAQSIVIGSGDDRISIHLKQTPKEDTQSLVVTSIFIQMGDLEIQIRRSTKALNENHKENPQLTMTTSSPITLTNGNQEKTHSTEQKSRSKSHWDYSASHGPHMWNKIFPEIQSKQYQSPIRIYTDQCEYDPMLANRPFVFDIDENCCQTLENTGHSFQVTGKGYSRITGGPVMDEYRFLQFHMHWGTNELEGSEHVVDGVRSPGELHIVTWNTSKYSAPQAAASSDHFDGIMVFGILLRITPYDNPTMAKLLDLLSHIAYKGEKINLNNGTLSLRSLMPKNMHAYYTYQGSLTTPMCYESVRWVVFQEQMGLSKRQLDQLRRLRCVCKDDQTHDEYLSQNFRPVMPLNGRTVYRSF